VRLRLLLLSGLLYASPALAQGELPPPVSGRTGDGLQTADVMARIRLLGAHLDRLRRHMGQPEALPPAVSVERAAPREVIFAAGNLGRRVAALEFERLRRQTPWRFEPPPEVEDQHLLSAVDRVLRVVIDIEAYFGLTAPIVEAPVVAEVEEADLMNALIAHGADVDGLLERPSTVSEGFMFITFATNIALDLHRVLTRTMMPQAPELVPGQTVQDAFMKLIACTERVRAVFERLDVPVAELELIEARLREADVGNLSNLISILIAELVWLSERVPGTRPRFEPYLVGPKLPSDLVQRAGLLEAVLADIEVADGLDRVSIRR